MSMTGIQSASDLYSQLGLMNEQQTAAKDSLQLGDFMNLMVTELTHQDPFKPMENSELATQVSQFATVSGIGQLNTSFNDLSTTLTSDQALQAASLVGRDVLIEGNVGWLKPGENMSGNVYLPDNASNLTVRITDASGALVREIELGSHESGAVAFNWDGLNDAGNAMPEGVYFVTASANIGDAEMVPGVLVAAEVESVSLGGSGGVKLNLVGLGQTALDSVYEIL